MKPLLSEQYLAHHLGIPLLELRNLAAEIQNHYRERDLIDEKKGKVRPLKVPDRKLRFVQRRILRRILDRYPLPDAAHGGVKGKSPRTNAAQHCGKPLVVSMDIKNFYPSVSHRQVVKMFRREFGCGRDTAWLLTRLTTIDGHLPQGAPTSTAIANVVLASAVDRRSETTAKQRNVTVTRFVDDFAFSGVSSDALIFPTARASSQVGLSVWRKPEKLKIMPARRRQEVTGLTVNTPSCPSVPREKRDGIKAAIHQLRRLPPSETAKEIQSIQGRLCHLEQYNPGSAKRLRTKFQHVVEELNEKGA